MTIWPVLHIHDMKNQAQSTSRESWIISASAWKYLKWFNVAMALAALYFTVSAITQGTVNDDGGYYLAAAKRLSEGWIPYLDFVLLYPPLPIYIFSAIYRMLGEFAAYSVFLTFILLLEIFSAYLVYRLSAHLTQQKQLRIAAALFLYISFLAYEGTFVFLEPFVVFFALLALLVFLEAENREKLYVLSGLLAAGAFISKQYGLAIMLALSATVVFLEKGFVYKAKALALFWAGFAALLVAFACVLFFLLGIPPFQMLAQLSGSGYGARSFFQLTEEVLVFVMIGAPFLILVPLAVRYDQKRQQPLLIAAFFCFLLFSLPLYFKSFGHYFLLLLPYASLLGVYSYSILLSSGQVFGERKRRIMAVILIAAFLVPISVNVSKIIGTQAKYSRVWQYNIARKINNIAPPGAKVLMIAPPSYLHLCDFLPPDPEGAGYSFVGDLSIQDIRTAIRKSNYAITAEHESRVSRERTGHDVKDLLESGGFEISAVLGRGYLTVWVKK